jgi:predicted dehydrogenase
MELNRRDVLKAALASASAGTLRAAGRPLRIGFVGLGARGSALVELALKFEGIEVRAVCDVQESHVARAQDLIAGRGRGKPEGYSRGETDFRRLCERTDVALVLNATPRQWHAPVCTAAMQSGKNVATEGPAGVTLDECRQLVETARKTGKHCTLLESSCYAPSALMVLNMFRGRLLGEPLFAEAGFCRDLRAAQFEGASWMLQESMRRNGNLSPTPAFGPVAWWMDINRGDRCTHLVATSTRACGMRAYAEKKFGPDDPRAKAAFALGDVNTALIRTERGRTISLYFDMTTPRPPESLVRVQGTKGVYSGVRSKIFVDGLSTARGESLSADPEWEDIGLYEKEFRHRLWTTHGEAAQTSGADYMLLYRLFESLRNGRPPDIDTYDAATWSAIAPLSEASIAGHCSMEFPDFTGGEWKTRKPLDADSLV